MASTFHSFTLLPQQQSSPQAIGSSIPSLGQQGVQQHNRQQPETPPVAPSATSEINRLTEEYEAEGLY
jgi:hypothetical protein